MFENTDPAWNDSATDLWRKLARVFYGIAVDAGFSGIEPNMLDSKISSMRKICTYTAYLAGGAVVLFFTYHRPGGVSDYLRPDGSSLYIRP